MDYIKFQREHRDEVVTLLAEMFMKEEPTTLCLKVPPATMTYYCRYVFDRALNDDISVVAIDTKQNRVVGAIANFLVHSANEDGGDIVDTDMMQPLAPVSSMMDSLLARFYELEEVKSVLLNGNMIMEVHSVAVRDSCQGRGIARHLLGKSLAMGMAEGAKIAYSELTGPISQHIMLTTPGFVQVGEMTEYTSFEYDGKCPFSEMPAAYKGAIVVMKRLNSCF